MNPWRPNGGSDQGPLKNFSGDKEDVLEHKRFKTWACDKMMTMDKLTKEDRGAYVMTLLSGKALECVQHLGMSEYQCEGGDTKIWKLLDERFPSKDKTDELGELLTEVFQLKVVEGETVKTWVARRTELFDRLARKTQVSFPEEARGWLILRRAGLNDEPNAIILARARGSLKREDVSQAIRPCFPHMTLSRKRAAGAAMVEEDIREESDVSDGPEVAFDDIELLLAEHGHGQEGGSLSEEPFSERDVAEILQVSWNWKEKHQELAKLQKTRRFEKARETKKHFRVEIEELKHRTKCHRCGKTGHWPRECKVPRLPRPDSSSASKTLPTSGAAMVESVQESSENVYFIASVEHMSNLCSKVQAYWRST